MIYCEKCKAESGKPASGSTPIALTVPPTRDRSVRSTRCFVILDLTTRCCSR